MSIEELASAAGDTPTESAATSAGTENTEAAAGGAGTTVPYERMEEQVRQREAADARAQQAEAAAEELRQRLESLETEVRRPKTGPAAHGIPANLPEPPDDLNERQKVDWYVKSAMERYIPSMLEQQVGDIGQVKTGLTQLQQQTKQAAEAAWTGACTAAGLDPNNREVQAMAHAFCSPTQQGGMGMALADGVKRIKGMLGGTSASNGGSPGASVESTPGATGGGSAEKFLPSTPEEAAQGARQGRRATHLSSQELIERRRAQFTKR
jgi:hypothetical protein